MKKLYLSVYHIAFARSSNKIHRSELSDTDSINRFALLEDAMANLLQTNDRSETKVTKIHSEMQRETLQQKDEIRLLRQENEHLSSRVVLLEQAIPSLVIGQIANGTNRNKRVLPFTTNPVNVAFHANVVGHIGLNDNEVIRFDRVNTNLESAYDGNNGIFQAPTTGYYVFFVHFLVLAQKRLEAQIVKNGNLIQNIFAGTQDVGNGPGSNLAILRLVQGDRVWVKVHDKYHDTGDILDGPWSHESLHGSYTEVPINNNVNNNQTFTCSPNQINQLQQSCTQPVLQSTPLSVQSSVTYQQSAPVPMQFLPPSVPSSVQTESLMPIPNITPQMIYSNINDTNHRLQRLEHVMNDKLSKLDLLDMFAEKFEKFENHISKMSNEINDIRNVQQKHSQTISKQENHHY
ncbi:unnamed protein product [Mytilus edulis]|uniref:C1q domain-containing protein n=1 Tax=Mytilus edulis TaxID=6550 RepID=A0A8S3QJ15_MYTED|nr:unnamed protein product [Mytilus edulis]